MKLKSGMNASGAARRLVVLGGTNEFAAIRDDRSKKFLHEVPKTETSVWETTSMVEFS